MIERILENWLDNTSERSFQVPFCFLLQHEGYKILHQTRHSQIEMGKDIIAISPDGTPCAFQLKSPKKKKISLSEWNKEIFPQVQALIGQKIIHPALNTNKVHNSFLVINGELEEEVSRAIDDFNRKKEDSNRIDEKLEVLVRGDILKKVKMLGLEIWPSELEDSKALLEIFLQNGNNMLPKENLSNLFLGILKINEPTETLRSEELRRRISSCALVCAIALSPFSLKENHVAEIEAWTIYISSVMACVEKNKLKQEAIKSSIEIALDVIYKRLELLCLELVDRKNYIEGNPFFDRFVYPMRIIKLAAYMAVWGFFLKNNLEENRERYEVQVNFIRKFCLEFHKNFTFFGEAQISQYLSIYWYLKKIRKLPKSEGLIKSLIEIIVLQNQPRSPITLPNPYYEEEYILDSIGRADAREMGRFAESSYTLEALVNIFVRSNWKQEMRFLWPKITRVRMFSFVPEKSWQFYLWRCDRGINVIKNPKYPKKWADLKKESEECRGDNLPKYLKENPIFFMLFLLVFPHRLQAEVVRFIDSEIQ